MKISKALIGAAVAVPMMLAAGTSLATPVALELTLVIDTSGSVDAADFDLQRDGYVAAFSDAAVHALIAKFTSGDGIAVRAVRFATSASELVPWTHLTDAASSTAFATALKTALGAGPGSGSTDIRDGLVEALSGHTAVNGFEGRRQVIDVSGDGRQNVDGACTDSTTDCAIVKAERDTAEGLGITINGLAILDDFADLTTYYTDNLKTSSGFVVGATFAGFESAIIDKIGREITGVPEPTTMVAFGAALLCLAGLRRRKA